MTEDLSAFHLERLGSHSVTEQNIIPLKTGPNTIGRLPTNNIVLSSKYVSRRHCTIHLSETGQATVKNDVTTNGIFVNGKQQLSREDEICLTMEDCLGIGCDTSVDEIDDAECFIFKLKRNYSEADKENEIILLDDSDEEEEDKIQEEYSQLNKSEMKQEYMELEDLVEEYNRMSSVKMEPDVELVPIEIVPSGSEEEIDDVFEQIIASSSKSFAQKTGLIKNVVPDVSSILMKDCAVHGDVEVPLSMETTLERNGSRSDTRKEKETKSKRESARKTSRENPKKESSSRRGERKKRDEKSSSSKDKSDATKRCKVVAKVDNPSLSSPQIRNIHVTISLPNLNTVIQPTTPTTPTVREPVNCDNKSTTPVSSRTLNRRNSFVPTTTPPPLQTNGAPTEVTPSTILHRRNTFVPSSSLSSGPTKRQLEIINAPHLLKRRKSISGVSETHKPPAKNAENKWLSKKVAPKGRSKEEIKSRFAALVPDPKDKIVEAKVNRSNTKVPVKNTHKTRSDQLTDTIVKTATPPTRKHKMNEDNMPTKLCKQRRLTEDGTAKEKPNTIQLRRPSFIAERQVPEKCTVDRISDSTAQQNGNSHLSNIKSTSDLNDNVDQSAATSPVLKSCLKKSKPIQKRRVTVTFAEEPRIKIIAARDAKTAVIPVAAPVRNEEENIDDVIHNIMSGGISALRGSSSSAINNFAYKTVADEYESLRQLQNVFIPLMKAELWKEIEEGYAHSMSTPETYIKVNFCSQDESHPNRFKYHCESQSAAAIQNGALILLFSVNSGKEFLGYIINRQIANKICYFQFVTPYSMQETTCPAPFKLKQIMYVRPNLKVFDAMFQLRNSPLIKHILRPKQNCVKPPTKAVTYKGHNSLNQDQMITLKTVYRKCIAGQPFTALIEGPPGTGKSRLITNLVLQFLYGKEMSHPVKILVCAPSNAAVDILTKNLMEVRKRYLIEKGQKKMKLVRFGVLEKMDVAVRGVSIQDLTAHNAKTVLIERNKLMECKKKKEAELVVHTAKNHREKIEAIRSEIAAIDTKAKNIAYDEKCLLEGANVICTTLNSCCALSRYKIQNLNLIPLQFGVKSLILVGDTKQLPSTVVSDIAKQYNYDQSLFQRLQKSFESASEFEDQILRLTTQYRMHPDILHWPNEYFYKNRLVADDATSKSSLKLQPYTVFNLNSVQSAHTGQKHISNVDEAKFVCNLLNFLSTKADPRIYSYGIISAYSQQKNDLAKALSTSHPYATVNTIDSCQGQERDVVIISIARTRGIGFLAIRQRLNVALTRAKKMLILCGNFNSLRSHPMWTSLLEDAKRRNLYVHLPTMDDSLLCSYFEQTLTLT